MAGRIIRGAATHPYMRRTNGTGVPVSAVPLP